MSHERFQGIWPKATLLPVIQLLSDLVGSVHEFLGNHELNILRFELVQNICVAEIQQRDIRVFPVKEKAYYTITRLNHGMEVRDGRAFVGLVSSGRVPITSPMIHEVAQQREDQVPYRSLQQARRKRLGQVDGKPTSLLSRTWGVVEARTKSSH